LGGVNIRARLQKLEKFAPAKGELQSLSDGELSALLAACHDQSATLPISGQRFSRILKECRI
jgi:hypothetical protein